jgi:hypothetical protein
MNLDWSFMWILVQQILRTILNFESQVYIYVLQCEIIQKSEITSPYIDMEALTWLQIRWAILKMWNQDGFLLTKSMNSYAL